MNAQQAKGRSGRSCRQGNQCASASQRSALTAVQVSPRACRRTTSSRPSAPGYWAEAQNIREERHGITLQVQSLTLANLRMAVPIGGIGKLEQYKHAKHGVKPNRLTKR